MMTISRPLGLAVAGLLQAAALIWLVADRVRLLQSPTEIVLPVRPVDPRDLFRGDYVTLAYDIGQVHATAEALAAVDLARPLRVLIERSVDGNWKATLAADPALKPGAGQHLVRGRAADGRAKRPQRADRRIEVRYGIEHYFVPEGTGRALEKAAADRKLEAVIAVGRDGELAIRGLMVDGRTVHRESAL
jgi:uncharacterized membrane-anchored protein